MCVYLTNPRVGHTHDERSSPTLQMRQILYVQYVPRFLFHHQIALGAFEHGDG